MSKQKAIFGIVLLFLLGVVTGIGLSVRLVKVQTQRFADGTPEQLADLVSRRMSQQLRLTPDQWVKVREVILHQLQQIRQARERIAPEVKAAEEAARKEIRAILTPEQLEKFESATSPKATPL